MDAKSVPENKDKNEKAKDTDKEDNDSKDAHIREEGTIVVEACLNTLANTRAHGTEGAPLEESKQTSDVESTGQSQSIFQSCVATAKSLYCADSSGSIIKVRIMKYLARLLPNTELF